MEMTPQQARLIVQRDQFAGAMELAVSSLRVRAYRLRAEADYLDQIADGMALQLRDAVILESPAEANTTSEDHTNG
jgi:hypothetical protein